MKKQTNIKSRLWPVSISYLLVFILQICPVHGQDNDPNMGIIPVPASIKKGTGTFVFTQLTTIRADNPTDKSILYLKDFLLNNHFKNKILTYNPKTFKTSRGKSLILTSIGSEGIPEEGYKLTVTPDKITIIGKGAGLFYGVQTFIQMFPIENQDAVKINAVTIEDSPRFRYRGMMLDVSRHFFNVREVKKVIDMLALYKINNFHWHLVDGAGWRIEIRKYPKLTEVGGTRLQTNFGGNRDYLDNVPYTGFYTQDDIREVVKYAADRYINVVPEIEMPAHSDAALRAYPELKCLGADGSTGRGNGIYCPTEETFTFLENVLTEVMELFPGKYIHIGGDEAGKQPWKDSQYCQDLIKKLGLRDENELQSYFIQRMEKFINSKGRSIIGWDEILEGGLAPNATVMSWQGEQGGIAAARQHHNVIMTPQTEGLYFDHYQSSSPQEPVSFGRYATLSETYNYDPVSKELTEEEKKYVIGTQGNLWTEYVPTVAKLQYQIFPRLFALSEVAWSKVENKNYKDFSEVRMPEALARIEKKGYNFRVPPSLEAIDTFMIGSQFTFEPKTFIPGARIYYTLNGRNPVDTDWEYDSPLTFFVPLGEKRELRTTVITSSGRRSISTRAVMYNIAPLPAAGYTGNSQGLKYKLIRKIYTDGQLETATVDSTGVSPVIETEAFKALFPNFDIVYEGYVNIPTDGIYGFSVSSYTNGSLYIDGENIPEGEELIPLMKGYHRIKVSYTYNQPAPAVPKPGQGGGGNRRGRVTVFKVFMTAPGAAGSKTEISPSILYN
jgi:hexosaminidase